MPATRSRSSGPLGALLSSPALDVRLITALQVLQEKRKGRGLQVATLVSHCAVNAAGWRRLRSTPSSSRLLVAAPGPAPCRCNAPFSGTGSRLFGYVVRPSLCPVHVARRQSRTTYGAARCCCGVGDGAFCTQAELPHSLRFQQSLPPSLLSELRRSQREFGPSSSARSARR